MKRAFCGAIVFLALTPSAYSQNQQNNKNAPPPKVVVRPVVRQQQARPVQQTPGRQPGQILPGQQAAGSTRLTRPGVVRGPAGALRTAMPANVRHNPAHIAGRAGGRYNRQAFLFRRGNHIYRRAYYLGPGGAAFFYDEEVADSDPALAAVAAASLPTCPEDADDCQGFNDPVAAQQAGGTAGGALQLLQSLGADCTFEPNQVVHTDPELPDPVPYNRLTVVMVMGSWSHKEYLAVNGQFNIPYERECILMVGTYAENKATFDKIISALRSLGARTTPPKGNYIDISNVL